MSMVAVLLAAGLAPAPAALGDRFEIRPSQFSRQGAPCPPLGHLLVPVKAAPKPPGVSPLGALPKANHTLTVMRSIDGCAVSSTVRYGVEGDGKAAE